MGLASKKHKTTAIRALRYNGRMQHHYDLHSHTTESDGTLSPAQLLAAAANAGVTHLAVTDHDTTEGLVKAADAAQEQGISLIPGVEISVTWARQTIHIVGLQVDPSATELQTGLARLREFRQWRAEEIGRRLEKAGVSGAYAGAKKFAEGGLISRTHFARYLVETGRAKSLREVFKKYLVAHKPGHVSGQWASLEEAVGWIQTAGGLAVIAHPARYRLTGTKLRRLIDDFRQAGGQAIEVVSGSHSRDEIQHIGRLAREHELYASQGSDFHGPENPWIELGKLPALPLDCVPVWQAPDWLARAA